MERVVFECESITPMFMYGANQNEPELRATSIKGALRFWWRAINGDKNIGQLRKDEEEIFGSTEKKSKVIIHPIETIQEKDCFISLTPHHREGYCNEKNSNCYFKNGKCLKGSKKRAKLYKFKIQFSLKKNEHMDIKQLEDLFKLTTLLGGFGQRSRRGFGSIQITKIDSNSFDIPKDANEIKNIIEKINEKFFYTSKVNYPFLKEIEIGKKYLSHINLLIKIGEATHKYNSDALGYAKGNKRLASPLYVSILKFGNKDYRPIISILNDTNLIDFKKAIL